MSWFNYYGLIAVILILIPNIILQIVNKGAFNNNFNNKPLQILEQIGRYGCMLFMVFNIPYTYFGFWFDNALLFYLTIGGVIIVIYYLGWIIFHKNNCLAKNLWLSITPTLLFLYCGIMVSSIPLIIFAVLFGICHITISCKNSNQNHKEKNDGNITRIH